jgi:hypothetical protein
MKNIFITLAACLGFITLQGQTMKWLPCAEGSSSGKCPCATSAKRDLHCYSLEYTPNATGTLNGYSTGFLVSCTSTGTPIVKNESCSMSTNVRQVNLCNEMGKYLLQSSGNGGSTQNNKVTKGVPVILHQVCFSVPKGESLSVIEEVNFDLTTTISIDGNDAITEYPAYEEVIVKNIRPDVSRPIAFLDFKGTAAGDFISQLDWTTAKNTNVDHYILEKSIDGVTFAPLATVGAKHTESEVEFYQYMDTKGVEGKNYYRLREVTPGAEDEFSPVREISFGTTGFSVSFSPNPADEFIIVKIQSKIAESDIQLIDAMGRVVLEDKTDENLRQARLQVQKLNPGTYTLVVKSGEDVFTEKVTIVK